MQVGFAEHAVERGAPRVDLQTGVVLGFRAGDRPRSTVHPVRTQNRVSNQPESGYQDNHRQQISRKQDNERIPEELVDGRHNLHLRLTLTVHNKGQLISANWAWPPRAGWRISPALQGLLT